MTEFVAEFTTNHMGNLNVLLRMVKLAKKSGADFIKMQMKDVETFYSKDKLNSEFDSPYGHTYRDYRTIFEFNREDWDVFDFECEEQDIQWYATVQDLNSLEFLRDYGLPKYKVASSNARDIDFLKQVSERIPVKSDIVISVAGSTLYEIQETLDIFPKHNIYILHCVAEYPCSPYNMRLGNIPRLVELFEDDRIKIGYSGHGIGMYDAHYAYILGAKMIEKHFCLSRHSFVHHIECSLEPEEFKTMVNMIETGVAPMYRNIKKDMFREYFGMSDKERSFLVDQTYGKDYIGQESEF